MDTKHSLKVDPRLDFPDGEFDGFLFDCDGTLVDSMPVHFVAWNQGLKAAGAPYVLEDADFYDWGGYMSL